MIVIMQTPLTMVAAAASPNFRSLYESEMHTGIVSQLGGYKMVVVGRQHR